MFGEQVYCRAHFEMQQQQQQMPPVADTPVINEEEQPQTPPGVAVQPPPPLPPPPPAGFFPPSGSSPFSTPPGFPLPQEGWFPGAGGPGDFHSGPEGEFGFENNNEPLSKKRRGRKKRKVEAFAPMNGFMEGAFPPGSGLDGSSQAKTKRARTSFKHHQLRIMKAHFQINQNPDSRELKMLSQKTGLDKKVLQVRRRR